MHKENSNHDKGAPTLNDPYLDQIRQHWQGIMMAYKAHQDKKPIIEYELPRQLVYAYPAYGYIEAATPKNMKETKQQYNRATEAGQFILFVRDTKNKILRSYVFPVSEQPYN